jgi:predicted ATPase/DNA-binding SARP family transcriptional activator
MTTVAAVEVRLLGQLEAVADDGSSVTIRGAKLRSLVAILALHRGEPVSSERLIAELWGDAPPGNPTNALQASVSQLRRAFGAAKIVTSDAGYALAINPDDLDSVRFERLVADGRRQLLAGDAAVASRTLHAALALCRDEPLIEFAYAEFALGERARLEELALSAVEARIEADLALGRHGEVTGELEALCQRHPLRERLWELSMLALYRAGRQADALRAFADARTALVEELGLDPGPGLKELEARVLAQDPGLDAPPEECLPAAAAGSPVGNLRESLTTFVGRDDDLARLVDVTQTRRLVTLIGPGGAGKTRLAVETAATLQSDYRDGAWLVELAAVRDPEAVAGAIASTLGAVGPGAVADASTTPVLGLLVGHLRGRSQVIVLDNCEHVVAAAATVVEALLGEIPHLLVIATSREPLGVPGEALFPVGGLDVDAAVELFADRGSAVRTSFTIDADNRPTVAELCRRLDHLPLALELAAARLRVLPLTQLVGLLDDRFRVLTGGSRTALARHQTLRAVVDWSHDLLFDDERRLFARLSVFTGGCGLEAVESVCADDELDQGDVLDLLSRLVDKSLVAAEFDESGDVRYSQLQTLWEYGRERLATSGEADAVRDRHAQWYLSVSHDAREGLRGEHGLVWRARISAELANLRGALDWYIARGDATSALSLTTGLAWVWHQRSDYQQGARWLEDALKAEGDASPTLRAAATVWHAFCSAWITGPAVALAEARPAIDILRDGSDPQLLVDALLILGELLNRNGDIATTPVVLAEARPILAALGDRWGMAAHELLAAGYLALMGELDAAEAAVRASVDGFQAIGEQFLVVESLGMLAGVAEARGDLEQAADAYGQLLEGSRVSGLANLVPMWLIRLGALRARQGDDATAEQLFAEAVARSSTEPMRRAMGLIGLAGSTRRLGDVDSARTWLEEAAAECESVRNDDGRTAVLTAWCWWALAGGDLEASADFADQACRLASHDDPSMPASAQTAAAAVAAVGSGSDADIEHFASVVRQRNGSAAGRFAVILVGAIGSTLDEPDVAALYATLGLAPVAG